jgi:hypothetical protein
VTSTELVVTLPSSDKIQFIAFSSNKLKQQHTIKVDGNCWGISCYQDKLVVSFCGPAKLQILDMDGIVLKTFQDKNIFKNPLFVEAVSSSIYISDNVMNRLTRINWYGQVIGSYGDMDEPGGITLSDDDTVFVCYKERHVLKEISNDLFAGNVLKVIKWPQAVCWCRETKKLYLSSDNRNYDYDNYDNFLHIYEMS